LKKWADVETMFEKQDDFGEGAPAHFPGCERMPKTARRGNAARQLIRTTAAASGFRERAERSETRAWGMD
jgi:hypothetical protein